MTTPLSQRFEQKVQRTEGCWLWTGALGGGKGDGRYGLIKHQGCTHGAHRVSYEMHKGPIPAGMEVMHQCDNPRCVNPDHLRLGTHLDNMRDMYSKGRRESAVGMRNGAGKLSEAQKETILRSSMPGEKLGALLGVSGRRVNQIRRAAALN